MHENSVSYGRISSWVGKQTGRPAATGIAVAIVLIWAALGPTFRYSDTWQLVINTGTTIITFIMVFLIQNSQMRDTQALQRKLDELIRASESAKNELINIEDLEDDELARVHEEYSQLAKVAREKLAQKRGG